MLQRTQPTGQYHTALMAAVLMLSVTFGKLAYADLELPDGSDTDEVLQGKLFTPDSYASVYSGYRFATPDGPAAAAVPYGRLKSGVTGGFAAGTLGADLKLSVTGAFLHEDDYHTELFFDYRGLVRFHAESTALWHNLLHEQLNPGTLALRSQEQDRTIGMRSATTQADTRIKLGNRPIHLNLGYWELNREGYDQIRFSDHYFAATANTLVSDTLRIDRVTREGSIGLDAHLGVLDLSYGFRIRDFSNHATDPRYAFTPNSSGVSTGDHHNAVPDNRVTSHTIKMFTDLSGGLVGTASYNLTQRENNGGHGDAVPSEHPSDLIQTVTGDLSYTPSKRHSFALKYRHREIDRNSPDSLTYPYAQITTPPAGITTAIPGELLVRPSSSSVRDNLTFSATFRPAPKVIYRLEYNAELEQRGNVLISQAPIGSPTALQSEHNQTHTGTAAFYWKPVTGIKVNSSYSYAACNTPSYGTSFTERHTGKILLTYMKNGTWGLTASYLTQHDTGERTVSTVAPAPVAAYRLPRESSQSSGNASFWFSPAERVTISTHYSYLETDSTQSILFASLIADASPHVVSNYHSSAHIYGVDLAYAVSDPLDLSLAFQQIRSKARFTAPDRDFTLAGVTGTFNTAGLTDLSRLATTETGLSARTDWRITERLGCTLEYTFRLFDSGQSLYDGSLHTTTVSLKARW